MFLPTKGGGVQIMVPYHLEIMVNRLGDHGSVRGKAMALQLLDQVLHVGRKVARQECRRRHCRQYKTGDNCRKGEFGRRRRIGVQKVAGNLATEWGGRRGWKCEHLSLARETMERKWWVFPQGNRFSAVLTRSLPPSTRLTQLTHYSS